jgi:hypothetical protein
VRILLTESASLTARETLTVLAKHGISVDLLDSGGLSLPRFTRWRGRLIKTPSAGADPLGYLRALTRLVEAGTYDAVLPTHEQAWLISAARHLLPADLPVAVASISAFDRVQGKLDFARLLDELEVPQPRWWLADHRPADEPFPSWVKASFGTAGRSVRRVTRPADERRAVAEFSAAGEAVMGQAEAPGQYGQVQALFDHGRLVAAHTAVQIAVGAGGSAAARLSVNHATAVEHAERIGRELHWHGGLTLDYLHQNGRPQFIECNPRTVEPGNAAAAGVDLPALQIALTRGDRLPAEPVIGHPGVATRSAAAMVLGAAERTGRRRDVAATMAGLLLRRGEIGQAEEVLTPLARDPGRAVALLYITGRVLVDPGQATTLARGAVASYSLGPKVIATVRTATRL